MTDCPTAIERFLLHNDRMSADTAQQDVRRFEAPTSKTSNGQEDFPESSTAAENNQNTVRQKIQDLVRSAKGEFFEDGMETGFSRGLFSVVATHEKHAVTELGRLILGGAATSEIASEALRWLGRMPDSKTYRARRWLLERCLLCPSPQVRDGAVLGLASMNDLHSVPYLKQAAEREPLDELHHEMVQVVGFMGASSSAVLTTKNP